MLFLRNSGNGREPGDIRYDLDYVIFRNAMEETETRNDLIKYLEQRSGYVISKIVDQNAKEFRKNWN
ncbi:MAG: hypothetical protein M0Z77_08195 [Thermoplasmatales archaeon]|nr:hypothetical protein [Thermoplasmatales archaeon]